MAKREIVSAAGVAAIAFAVFAPSAGAATIVVNTTVDDYENGSGCSLREAVQVANGIGDTTLLGCAPGDFGLDTILLTPGQTYELTRHNPAEDNNLYGDLDIKDPVTIKTNGTLATIDGGKTDPDIPAADNDRVIQAHPDSDAVTLERIRVTNGREHAGGDAGGGGGIRSDGDLSLIDSEVVGNEVSEGDPAQNTWGGGIFGNSGSVTLNRSTVAANTLADNGEESADGGGIMVYNATSLTATNSTISGNTAEDNVGANHDALGGGIFAFNGAVNLTNVTITGNSAQSSQGTGVGGVGGGIYRFATLVPITLTSSIVAGNTASGSNVDCRGAAASGGSNVVGDCTLTGGGNDLTGVAAGLGSLGLNGGLTRTHPLLTGSLAIDLGGSCPATDQRGISRPQGAACDAGAFELEVAPTPPPPGPTVTFAPPAIAAAAPTGLRAAALAKCKKKPKGPKRRKCKAKANQLPI
jgi:CSLREA domain-containing protein